MNFASHTSRPPREKHGTYGTRRPAWARFKVVNGDVVLAWASHRERAERLAEATGGTVEALT